jgi:hypothetical protein
MLRARLTLLLIAVSGVAVVMACTEDPNAPPTAEDAGPSANGSVAARCPDVVPSNGGVCLLPDGTTCAFGACGTPVVQCLGGTWRHAANVPPRLPCPSETPESDSPCSPCWPPAVACTYGSADCTQADASAFTASATCDGVKWTVAFRACLDAGADVQGDASAAGD